LKAIHASRASTWSFALAAALAACSGGAAAPDNSSPAKSSSDLSSQPPPSAASERPIQNRPALRATTASGPKVAFLGDSISAGLHLPAEQAYPAVLRERLAARGLSFELLNAGVSGDTTAGGLRRVDWLLKQSPAIVVVELGANDSMRGQPIPSIEQNLRAIIEKVRARGATPLLLGMRIPTSYGPEYAAQFEAIYPRIAKDLNVAFVPFFMEGVAGIPELNLEDGIHPTPAGHIKLAQACEEPLAKLLTQVATAPR
jgi:acyl-CoA thioesterase-1